MRRAEPTKSALNALAGLAMDPSVKVISVDVFDTVLLRTTRPEFQRFADIASRSAQVLRQTGVKSVTAEHILAARLTAAECAYRTAEKKQGLREPNFATILELMTDILRLPAESKTLLHHIELEYERSVLFPNRPLIKLLKTAKRDGKPVIFVSDMYLSGADIRHLIESCAPECPIDTVYSSADVGLSKRHEAMFPHIAAAMGYPLANFLHIGDNPIADVEVPRRLGMQSIHTPRSRSWHALHDFRVKHFRARLKRKGLMG